MDFWADTYWADTYWTDTYWPHLLVFITPECRIFLAESANAPISDRSMRVSAESGEPMSDRNMRISAQSFAQQQCSRVYVIEKEQ